MSTLKKNVIANYAGKTWAAIINIAFVPFYIKYMGIEAYGLVGIFATIQPLMAILDLGLSPTINRELARYSASPGQEQQMRDLVRTLEVVYWSIASVICVIVLLLAPVFASKWVHAQALPADIVNFSVMLMGFALVFQWPVGFYSGGLMGLQKQVLFNVLNTIIWTVRGVGALLVVMFSSNPVLAFFWWQLLMSVVNVAAVAMVLWRSLPPSVETAKFRNNMIRSVWRLAIGMSAVSIVILLFNQLDKIILSNQISLTDFGYYSLAWQVVGSLFMLYYPIYSAFFPVLSRHFAQKDMASFKLDYHKGCQLMSVAVLPIAVVLALFAEEILLMWVKDPLIVANSHLIISILVIGATINGTLCMQYAIQQAIGQTRYMLYILVPFVFVYAPLIFLVSQKFGVLGASITFSAFSIVQGFIVIIVTHNRFIPGEQLNWFWNDMGRPLMASIALGLVTRFTIRWPITGFSGCVTILCCFGVTFLAAVLVTPDTNRIFRKCFRMA